MLKETLIKGAVGIASAGILAIAGWVVTLSGDVGQTSADLDKHKAVQEVQYENIQKDLTEIKEILHNLEGN
jgi:hypothetical protein